MLERRKLLKTGAAIVPATLMAASLPLGQTLLPNPVQKAVCIMPVEGYAYTDGFLAFMRRARFSSIEAAMKAVRNQEVPFRIEIVEEVK